jgi:DNA-binding phage protein
MMAKKRAKAERIVMKKMPPEVEARWRKSLAEVEADRETILAQGRAVFAAHETAREVVERLKQERERRGISLADMLRRTGMTREALSRLENNLAPNPTVRTLARYAAAVGLELHLAAKPRR